MIPNSLGSTCEVWTSKKATLSPQPPPGAGRDSFGPVFDAFVPRSLGSPPVTWPPGARGLQLPAAPTVQPAARRSSLPASRPGPVRLRAVRRLRAYPARRPLTSFGTSWFSSPGTIAQTPTARLRPACGGRVEVAAARCLRREGQRQSSSQPPELPQPRRPRLRP